MDIRVQTRNITLSPAMQTYLDKKIGRLERLLNGLRVLSALLEVTYEDTRQADRRYRAEITLDLNGRVLRAEERAGTLEAAVDAAVDTIDRRVSAHRAFVHRGEVGGKAGRGPEAVPPPAPPPPSIAQPLPLDLPTGKRLVRIKRFPMKPMSVEEAALQMEALGHQFFLFQNLDTGRWSVLYRRENGDYGLIEAEPA
ncbi:MAG: ribosome-associated translation inhibitor RaiA [Dehalococcoidia bacterium]|nr:ribosome-associated translation inhibitor RaiA [Dehalococcoidia bacterium]MDW8120633.1 ribosome-associated translation inhibitor RaiA [Chloroflexota bacterium]